MRPTLTPGVSLARVGQILRNAILFGPDAWDGGALHDVADRHQRKQLLPSDDEVLQLFSLLRDRKVPYLLVGGIAMLRYVAGRNTEDIDLLMSAPSLKEVPDIVVEEKNE